MMNTRTKRTTVYLDPSLYKALRMKAIVLETSVSEIINEAIRLELAEDAEDLAAIEERKNETPIPYDEFIKGLKEDGLI